MNIVSIGEEIILLSGPLHILELVDLVDIDGRSTIHDLGIVALRIIVDILDKFVQICVPGHCVDILEITSKCMG